MRNGNNWFHIDDNTVTPTTKEYCVDYSFGNANAYPFAYFYAPPEKQLPSGVGVSFGSVCGERFSFHGDHFGLDRLNVRSITEIAALEMGGFEELE